MKIDYNCIFDLVVLIFEKNSYFNNIAKRKEFTMVNYNIHEDCKILSRRIYPENRQQNSQGWKYRETYSL